MPEPGQRSKARWRDPPFQAQVVALRQQGLSFRDIAERLDSNYADVNRAYHAATANGIPALPEGKPATAETTAQTTALALQDPPIDVALQPIVQPVLQAIAPRLDEHEGRIQALEALVANLQQRPDLPTLQPTAILQPTARLHSEPARPRSIQMETDLFDTLKSFCKAEHRQMKEVVDTALSRYFSEHGWTIAEGGRDA